MTFEGLILCVRSETGARVISDVRERESERGNDVKERKPSEMTCKEKGRMRVLAYVFKFN